MISTLQEQIEVAARTIATDSYAMSIGEIINKIGRASCRERV